MTQRSNNFFLELNTDFSAFKWPPDLNHRTKRKTKTKKPELTWWKHFIWLY